MLISSLQNPRVKDAVRLWDRRDRDRTGKTLIEGYRELLRALSNQFPVDELFHCPELFQGVNEPALIERFRQTGTQVFQTTPDVFRKMAYRDRPEGLLAVAPQQHRSLADIRLGPLPPLLIVAEAIEKPGNLGTMLRSADATGVDAVILCDRCTDLFNPNVVRASIGTLFSMTVAETTTTEAIAWLQARGVGVLAATPHAAQLYTDVDLTGPTAIVVGTEQHGLSEAWMAQAKIQVRIPMLGQADSLNVATATALLLYEAVRQRAAAGVPSSSRRS
ncbi:MAG: rRNA methyltransferase [Lentisphaerae bacterium RIFOXYA12_64_32]|nr:MAG: rRNA methyltransferase [Lentisphaerae bacterium RIFOXYA12_64_32]